LVFGYCGGFIKLGKSGRTMVLDFLTKNRKEIKKR
jgi:hypothetical protein